MLFVAFIILYLKCNFVLLDVALDEQLVVGGRFLGLLDQVRDLLEMLVLRVTHKLENDRLAGCDISTGITDALN